jgi:1-deoxy-D-xylulose-5-phosphate reductoisomerase
LKKVVILGSTGSIGESALRVAAALPDRIRVTALAVQRGYKRALEQALRFGVRDLAVADREAARRCAAEAPSDVRVYAGPEGIAEVAGGGSEADVVLCAVVGMAGLQPVLAAIEAGRDVALATKEVLVAAGAIVNDAAARRGCRIIPVDSEHSAIFQCLSGRRGEPLRVHAKHDNVSDIRRLLLTASGGPFAFRPEVDLARVTPAEALAHPRWNMGKKVSIDSATMMNKGLEIMEAHWLFHVPAERIEVLLHPESIVHSLVEFADGSMLAQLSEPDMRFAIQYALTCPEHVASDLKSLDLAAVGQLRFASPDEKRFPSLGLAREAARRGGTLPAVLNAANEIAVQRFLDGRIGFADIWGIVEAVMDRHDVVDSPSLQDIMGADEWARRDAAAHRSAS